MGDITRIRHQQAAEAAQRLVLGVQGDIEYRRVEDFEADIDAVIELLEEARDACWPGLEERARRSERAEDED